MSTRGVFVEYPAGMERRIEQLKEEIETQFYHQSGDIKEAILSEILGAYRIYYLIATNKSDAYSNVVKDLDSMGKAARKMLKSIEAMKHPISTHYELWMRRTGDRGTLKLALENHLEAVKWTKRQLENDPKSKPQPKAQARKILISKLQAIFETHNPESKKPDFKDTQGAFVSDVLEAFGL